MSQSDDQLELFSDSQDDPKTATNRVRRNSFLTRIWGYEKAVLFIILFLVTSIVSFSLGVERGRSSSLVKQTVAIVKEPVVVKLPVKSEPIDSSIDTRPVVLKQNGQYTIQVASFKAGSYARKEAAMLKKIMLRAGTYVVGIFRFISLIER